MALPRILLVTSELFPEFGVPTAGGGVRAQQLYHSIQEKGYPVELALWRPAAESKSLPDWATRYLYSQPYLDGTIEQADPDIVLSESWECLSHLKHDDNRIYIVDCPGPLVLENLVGREPNLRGYIHHKIRTLARMDAVLCPSSRMKSYLTGYLTLSGWQPNDSKRLIEVPISLPEETPVRSPRKPDNPLQFFMGGVNWSWHRTSEWLTKLGDWFGSEEGRGTLSVRMGHHPLLPPESEAPFENLKRHPSIRFSELTDFDTLTQELLGMDVAIDWSPVHFERNLATPFRIINYLWCGLPVIVRPHLEVSGLIHEYGAGWVVESWEELEDLLTSLHANPSLVEKPSMQAQRLAREKFSWPSAHSGLMEFFENPSLRDKKPSYLMHAAQTFRDYQLELERRNVGYKAMEEELGQIRQRLSEFEADANAYRNLKQRFHYRLWKKIFG
ncbi:MAG: hypothetical protein KC994_03570 [Candidatus Omnitrophica bacterium]|nr:hypothetical protein [Candidatus Omnitrophota bacterium]